MMKPGEHDDQEPDADEKVDGKAVADEMGLNKG